MGGSNVLWQKNDPKATQNKETRGFWFFVVVGLRQQPPSRFEVYATPRLGLGLHPPMWTARLRVFQATPGLVVGAFR